MKKYFIVIVIITILCGCQVTESSYFKLKNTVINNDNISCDIAFKDVKALKIRLEYYNNGELVDSCPLKGYGFPKEFEDSGKLIFEYTMSNNNKNIIVLKMDTESKMTNGIGDTRIFSSYYDMNNLSVLTIKDNLDVKESQYIELLQFVDNESFLKGINNVKESTYGYVIRAMIEFY